LPHNRIVVAEDDHSVRALIRARLSAAGYDTHTAHDGEDAVNRIRNLHPDGVVLDINMPVLDGFAVLARLNMEDRLRDIPVLMLTARHASEDVHRAIYLGAKDFLTKPFSDGQLLARVARLVRSPLSMPAIR
jgi:DNA-binding response OmpR family regulator